MSIERRSSGERWRPRSARDENLIAEATERVISRKRIGAGIETRDSVAGEVVYIKNDSGSDRAKGEVLEIFDLLPDAPEDDAPLFEGDTPLDSGATFAILRQAVPAGKIAEARISGHVIARVNVTDSEHDFAEVSSGSHVMQSSATGPVQIIWKPTGTGENDSFVLLGGGGTTATFYRIWFKIQVVLSEYRSVLATVLGTIPGQNPASLPGHINIGGFVEICDPAGCFFNEPESDLLLRQGTAWYMQPHTAAFDAQNVRENLLVCGTSDYDNEPVWMVDGLCCPGFTCDSE